MDMVLTIVPNNFISLQRNQIQTNHIAAKRFIRFLAFFSARTIRLGQKRAKTCRGINRSEDAFNPTIFKILQ
jgi:hypothetical protein